MSNTIWNSAVDGDWSSAADWSLGVPTAKRDAVINADGTYTVTISSADLPHSLTIDGADATLSEESGGGLTMAGGLTIDAGTVSLNGVNHFGADTELVGGTLELGNAKALGTSGLTIDGGALVGTTSENLSNTINANGTFILAAAHGETLRFADKMILNMNGEGTIQFGETGDDGHIIWAPLTLGVAAGGTPFSVDVNAGTLSDHSGSLAEVFDAAQSVNIAAGAKISIGDHSETIHDLKGSGTITSGADGGQLTVDGGVFSGIVNGFLAVNVENSLTLTGVLVQTNGTTVGHGASLLVEGNGAVRGNIVDDGFMRIDRTVGGTPVYSGIISGTGALQLDSGSIALDGINTYSGGTFLFGGTLEIGNGAAIGTGPITLENGFPGGTLLATATASLSNQITIARDSTFLAAHGTTLTLNTGAGWILGDVPTSMIFGSSADDGVIVWHTPSGSTDMGDIGRDITVAGGTLQAGDNNFQTFLNSVVPAHSVGFTDIEQNGTLDVAGITSTIYDLTGTGTIKDSGASATVTLTNSNFSGSIAGPITLDVSGITTLGGNAANWSAINILSTTTLNLDAASSSSVDFSAGNTSRLSFDDLSAFTGSVKGFAAGDWMQFPSLHTGLSVSYSGTTTGGTLTVSSPSGSAHITMIGDYTGGSFSVDGGNFPHVTFAPNPAPTEVAHADAFDFNAAAVPSAVTSANVASLLGGHPASEFAFAHDVTDAMHAQGFMLDHFVHSLFAHGHGFAEALL